MKPSTRQSNPLILTIPSTLDWSLSVSLKLAAAKLRAGEVIAYPTEAVWGLGCDPFNEHATNTLLGLKNRAWEKGVILIGSSIEQFDFLLFDLPEEKLRILKSSWPGPHTWIVPHHQRVPQWIRGTHAGVAIRVTDHPLVKALCHLFSGPIVSTSANPQAKPPAQNALKVRQYFRKDPRLAMVTPGVVGKSKQPSEIRDLLSMQVIRV